MRIYCLFRGIRRCRLLVCSNTGQLVCKDLFYPAFLHHLSFIVYEITKNVIMTFALIIGVTTKISAFITNYGR
jgi:hypothetical protein